MFVCLRMIVANADVSWREGSITWNFSLLQILDPCDTALERRPRCFIWGNCMDVGDGCDGNINELTSAESIFSHWDILEQQYVNNIHFIMDFFLRLEHFDR